MNLAERSRDLDDSWKVEDKSPAVLVYRVEPQ
jgi:hypothetical protein